MLKVKNLKMANNNNKSKKDEIIQVYEGKVIVDSFKIKNKTYILGDIYKTKNKSNYDILLTQKRIK